MCVVKAGEPTDFQERPHMIQVIRGFSHILHVYDISQCTSSRA